MLDSGALSRTIDVICPMSLLADKTGAIFHVGPTLSQILPSDPFGKNLDEVLTIKKPFSDANFSELSQIAGQKLTVGLKEVEDCTLVGVAMPLNGNFLVNLSFGIDIVGCIKRFNLEIKDFAYTDPVMTLLFLTEAKSAAVHEYKKLSRKLAGESSKAISEANTDALTGLLNYRGLEAEISRLTQNEMPFAVMMMDLDFFKEVNDSLGHSAGDLTLQHAAKILKDETRKNDVLARNGGDEFTILLSDCSSPETAQKIADRVISRIKQPVQYGKATIQISASLGAIVPPPGLKLVATEMLSIADKALYLSKNAGRGQSTVWTSLEFVSTG